MITATFFKDSKGQYRGFSLIGHAGYSDYGSDIVCAAVSVLAINTVNSIENFTSDDFIADTDEETGLLSFSFTGDTVSKESTLLIDSLLLGLDGIKENYNDDTYLKTLFKEV